VEKAPDNTSAIVGTGLNRTSWTIYVSTLDNWVSTVKRTWSKVHSAGTVKFSPTTSTSSTSSTRTRATFYAFARG